MSAHVDGPSRNIPSTLNRGGHFGDHMPPNGKHSKGREGLWHGSHRVLNRGAKRRKNAATWRKLSSTDRSLAAALIGEQS